MKFTFDTDKIFGKGSSLLLKAINTVFVIIVGVIIIPLLTGKFFEYLVNYGFPGAVENKILVVTWFFGAAIFSTIVLVLFLLYCGVMAVYRYYLEKEENEKIKDNVNLHHGRSNYRSMY